MILLLDNYDSYVQNVARYLRRLGQQTRVVRSDEVTLAEIHALAPAAIVISPGPRTPAEAGVSVAVVREFSGRIPLLGICLGHQAIAAAFGGEVVRSERPVHGKTSLIQHDSIGLFAGLPNPLVGCRYHSLVVKPETLPADLVATARTQTANPEAAVMMALAHREHATFGLQFHPESVLTNCGYGLLANFLKLAGLDLPSELPDRTAELTGKSALRNEPTHAVAAPSAVSPGQPQPSRQPSSRRYFVRPVPVLTAESQ